MPTDQSTSYLNEHTKYRRLEEEIARLKALLRYVADLSPPDIRTRIVKELGEA